MAAPEFVPTKPLRIKAYTSPPRRPDPWRASRPGETIDDGQPEGGAFGFQGPDQGYALVLANRLRRRLRLTDGESADDVIAGAVAVALRRASIFGRAPVVHDVTMALNLFGFLEETPPSDLVARRRELFEEVSSPHHYAELRHLASAVPESTLRKAPDEVAPHRWRELIGALSGLPVDE